MFCIVPLAGPDFFDEASGTVKPLTLVDGIPLVVRAIKSRAWYQSGELTDDHLVFVLRETPVTIEFAQFLRREFPGCHTITLQHLTRGALLTATAGVSLISDPNAIVCVDLVDILYDAPLTQGTVRAMFDEGTHVRGIIPCFTDTYDKYSYLEILGGKVVRTAEKRQISDVASAGTYFFRDAKTLLAATAGSMARWNEYAYKDSLFVCPSFNELIRAGGTVLPWQVQNVVCLSRKFSHA